jgi:hypothetical protein
MSPRALTAALSVSDGVIGSYVHNQIAPGLGKIGRDLYAFTGKPIKYAVKPKPREKARRRYRS